jgi:hypothetical protein
MDDSMVSSFIGQIKKSHPDPTAAFLLQAWRRVSVQTPSSRLGGGLTKRNKGTNKLKP